MCTIQEVFEAVPNLVAKIIAQVGKRVPECVCEYAKEASFALVFLPCIHEYMHTCIHIEIIALCMHVCMVRLFSAHDTSAMIIAKLVKSVRHISVFSVAYILTVSHTRVHILCALVLIVWVLAVVGGTMRISRVYIYIYTHTHSLTTTYIHMYCVHLR